MNLDGSTWGPGARDCMCLEHFVTGKKCDVLNSLNYVPSTQGNRASHQLPAISFSGQLQWENQVTPYPDL